MILPCIHRLGCPDPRTCAEATYCLAMRHAKLKIGEMPEQAPTTTDPHTANVTPETRPTCPACGQINGEHLTVCKVATLEQELTEMKAQAAIRCANCILNHDMKCRPLQEAEAEVQRARDFIVEQSADTLGGGETPVEFLIASYKFIVQDRAARLQSLEHELERARKDAERIDFVERVNPLIFHKSSADDQWEICIDPMAPVLKEGEQTFCGDTFRAALDSARRTSGDERG